MFSIVSINMLEDFDLFNMFLRRTVFSFIITLPVNDINECISDQSLKICHIKEAFVKTYFMCHCGIVNSFSEFFGNVLFCYWSLWNTCILSYVTILVSLSNIKLRVEA